MKFLRKLFFWIFWLFSAFVLAVVLIIFVVNFRDEELNPEYNKLTKQNDYTDEENGYFALIGLAAPKDVTYTFAYGKTMAKNTSFTANVAGAREVADVFVSGNYESFFTYVEPKENPSEIKFIHRSKECFYPITYRFKCFELSDGSGCEKEAPEDTFKNCIKKEELEEIVSENQLILSRYNELYKYKYFSMIADNLSSSSNLIHVNKVLPAHIINEMDKGNADIALPVYIENLKFIRRAFAGSHDLTADAVFLLIHGMNVRFLPEMIKKHPEIIEKHGAALVEVLKPMPHSGYIDGIISGEKEIRERMLSDLAEKNANNLTGYFLKVNATKNDFVDYAKHIKQLSELSYLDLKKESDHFRMIKESPAKTPIEIGGLYNPVGKQFTDRPPAELFLQSRKMDADFRLLGLYVQILQKKLKKEEVAEFIKSNPDYYNPLTDKPFEWDDGKKVLYYIAEEHKNVENPFIEKHQIYLDELK